ncbi:hypothetical protein TREMEDRAFT_25231, partial [Tremella mesenterica DSM 1558]|uniref:uncharacterized protein n=1 Tax=Tremella mesenterica (strain ATCC 24925 / CBS 8224 / DSM 1558 / NBRC 9311 / NRRL Y-6157 / RJB 2259-6 / UBC 559-6) TaxID=578456 RepID=UPI0003F4918E
SYVSDSITDILGYEPEEIIGHSVYERIHPDEMRAFADIHWTSFKTDRAAAVTFLRMRHKNGEYVDVCVAFSIVYNMTVSVISRASEGPRAFGARVVFELSPSSQGRSIMTVNRSLTPQPISFSDMKDLSDPELYTLPRPRHKRTFFLFDRFTETARVMFVSNDVITKTSSLSGKTFYSVVRPSHRLKVKTAVESLKRERPVAEPNDSSPTYRFVNFDVLKIPDLPPQGQLWPLGTDESERSMPGQEFIPVEGIFCACSDGMTCIIDPLWSVDDVR